MKHTSEGKGGREGGKEEVRERGGKRERGRETHEPYHTHISLATHMTFFPKKSP